MMEKTDENKKIKNEPKIEKTTKKTKKKQQQTSD